MSFLKRLFGDKKSNIEPARGTSTGQSQDQQDETRRRMETEMLDSQGKRNSSSVQNTSP
jgi:hypothetical protein